jgi:thiamine-phosphate pyrophosphorylase
VPRGVLPARPFLYPIVDVDTLGEAGVSRAARALAGTGVRLMQLRAKALSDRALVAVARDLLGIAHAAGIRLVVNDRPDVARLVGADGVHVGQDDLSPWDARAIVGEEAIVGFSTHNLEQLQAATRAPVDYLALGPIFATASKDEADPVVGLERLARARALTTLPLVAIGGLTRANAGEVVAAGADGLAVIGDLFRGPDLPGAVKEFALVLVG